MKKKAKLRDERIIDSICTNEDTLKATMQEIVRRIEYYIQLKGYTVTEVSQVSGVSTSVLYRMQKDATKIGLETLLKLLWALDVRPEKIIPLYNSTEFTYSERFEELTKCLSIKQKDYLLTLMSQIIGMFNVDIECNEYKNIPQIGYKIPKVNSCAIKVDD